MRSSSSALAVFGLGLPLAAIAGPSLLQSRSNAGASAQSWAEINPSPELVWTPCFDKYTCAMLEVPLDYTNSSLGSTPIAFMKQTSSNSSARDILLNPGGPGSSGVNLVWDQGDFLINQHLGNQYNIVGFDPRGVNNSRSVIPLECYPDNAAAKMDFGLRVLDRPVDDSSRMSLCKTWELQRGWGERCTLADALLNNGTAKYANTVAGAHDMLRYVELDAKNRGQPVEASKLWYIGFSYGTVLGETFATLFPDRVGRMILDGVVDGDDYYAGAWRTSVESSDAAVKSFFQYCFEAGPDACAFHGNSSCVEEIEQRFFKIFDWLKEQPQLIDAALSATSVLVEYRDLKGVMFTNAYDPIPTWPGLAAALAGLETDNITSLSTLSSLFAVGYPVDPKADQYSTGSARTQIGCIDAMGRTNLSTIESYEEHVWFLTNTSFFGGNTVASIFGAPCRGIHILPPESQQFPGPIGSNATNTPILFIGNTYDPITPLASAKRMSSKFARSAVLQVNGTGHCSRRLRSKCNQQHLQAYLADGTLPPPNTVCPWDETPFVTVR